MADQNTSLPVRTQSNNDIIAGIGDGTTPTQLLAIDASGRITVKLNDGIGSAITSQISGSQRALDVGIVVSGTQIDPRQIRALTAADIVTAQQGTSPWVTSDLADGSVTGGTAGTKSMLSGAIYNTALPTLTNGQQAALQLDSSGRLLVDIGTEVGVLNTSDSADGPVTPGTVATKSILTGGQFNTTLPTLTTGQQAALQVDSSGRLIVDLGTALPAGTNNIGSVNQGTSPWITSDLADGSLTGGTAGTKSLAAGGVFTTATGLSTPLTAGQQAAVQVDANGRIIIGSIVNALPAGTNLLGGTNVYVGGTIASATNPVPVTISTTTPGTAVQDYHTSVALAVGASTTFTYTVAASHTFNLERVWASASGKIKAVVQNGATTIFAGFNSTANPNIDITIVAPPLIAAAGTVNVIITNDDKVAFDVYTTIEGNQN